MKRMTVILVLTTLAAWAASPLAAPSVPQVINLQGRFTDGAGNNVADGVYTVTFRIYDDTIAGSELWVEKPSVQVTDGLFTVLVGSSEAIPEDLFSSGANRYLGVTVNSEPEMPRIPLNSVAYAYQAQDARAATLAQNLICAGCVSAGEIAADAVGPNEIATDAVGTDEIAPESVGSAEIGFGAVGSAEIQFGAVGANAIATDAVGADEIDVGAVGTAEVADGSLTAVDIGDEPGVASNTSTVTIVMDGTTQTLLSRSITAPAAGYVLAIATAQVNISHINGDNSHAAFGVSTTPGVFPPNQYVRVFFLSTIVSAIYMQAVTVHGLFSTSGGLQTLYFLGEEVTGSFSATNLQLTLIYFPTAYGTVVEPAAASGGEISSYQDAEVGLVVPEISRAPVQSQVVDLAGIQQALAQVKSETEARIQKLEEHLRVIETRPEEKR